MASALRVLDIGQLGKRFGGIRAIESLDLHIDDGEIVGLIGPNGAGKTALINVISGFYRADEGRVEFMGASIAGLSLHEIGRRGIGRTFQNIRLFRRMTVLENVMVADKRYAVSPWQAFLGFSRRGASVDEAMAWLETMKLADRADASAGSLSYGEARRLEIARALAGRPALLLLDEPAAGMNESETEALIDDILVARGKVRAMMLIEHDMGLIRRLSDRVIAMDSGRKIAEGSANDVLAHPDVRRAYLGEDDLTGAAS